jgi:ATP-dependent Clp protease protease subunit
MDTDRDFFMSGEEAREYGLIDKVMASRDDLDETIKQTEA